MSESESGYDPSADTEPVNVGPFKGFPKNEVHEMGQSADEDTQQIRSTWKKLAEDEKRVGYQTPGGVFVEEKQTGRLTRVGDTARVKGAGAGK
jgi:hypothetical protein